MKYMESTTQQSSEESEATRYHESAIFNQYSSLLGNVKKTLITKPKINKPASSFVHHQHRRPVQQVRSKAQKSTKQSREIKNPYLNFAFRPKPIVAAKRIYDNPARKQLIQREQDDYMEFVEYPTPQLATQFIGGVNPYLHVGRFNETEIDWTKLQNEEEDDIEQQESSIQQEENFDWQVI